MSEPGKLSDVKVGVFVVTALAILVAGSLWVAGSGMFGASRVPYRVLLRDSAGLAAGDRVRVAGVAVGRIQGVELRPHDPWPVLMRVQLKSDLVVKTDSSATVATSGLLGTAFLQIDTGTPEAPRLPADGEIRGGEPGGLDEALAAVGDISQRATLLLEQASLLVETISTEIGPILANLEALLSERNAENLEQLLATAQRTMDEAGPRLTSLLERMESLSGSAEQGLENLPDLTERVAALADDLQAAIGPDGARLAQVLDAAGRSLASADETLSAIGGSRDELEATLRDLRDTAANLKAFSREVKERPFRLVRVKAPADRRPGDGVRGAGR